MEPKSRFYHGNSLLTKGKGVDFTLFGLKNELLFYCTTLVEDNMRSMEPSSLEQLPIFLCVSFSFSKLINYEEPLAISEDAFPLRYCRKSCRGQLELLKDSLF